MWFNDNGWDLTPNKPGLQAVSYGSISFSYIDAHHNNGWGLAIVNEFGPYIRNVSVRDVYISDNWSDGLYVGTLGSITIKGIDSHNNGGYGAYLDNRGGGLNVTVTTTSNHPSNHFSDNSVTGLDIASDGSVYLKNIGAGNNGCGAGIYVKNTYGLGSVTYESTNGMYWLSENGTYGLYVESYGNVIIDNKYGLNASNNGGSAGVYIENSSSPYLRYVKLYRVTANENGSGNGIEVQSAYYIYAYSLTAENNWFDGANLQSADGNITVKGRNYFSNNNNDGLFLSGNDAITVYNAIAMGNNWRGIIAATDAGPITIKYSTAAHNGYSGYYLNGNGNFYLYKVIGFLNGQADFSPSDDDGLHIVAGEYSNVTIKYSSFMTNWWGNGIDIEHPNIDNFKDETVAPYLTLYKTSYLSNGEENLHLRLPTP